ncbi:MAG TPA: hypothetical protein VHK02_04485 [Actinomycetota bacterium]|jgi:hypothetical protein|nr:hypothetical protein [Actinomycetota bacterium]
MGHDVFPAEMPEPGPALLGALDHNTVERLVSGRMGPDDAPPGYAGVASVLQSAGGPAGPDDLAGQEAAMAMFRAHRPAGERRGALGRPRGRSRARVVALALAGVMAAGGLWMAGGARTVPGLRSPTGGPGAGGAGSGTPAVVTQARPLAPPVTAPGADARAPVPFSSRERSSRTGGVTAGHASAHGANQHRPGKPPKPKPKKPRPETPRPETPRPETPRPEQGKAQGKAKPGHEK